MSTSEASLMKRLAIQMQYGSKVTTSFVTFTSTWYFLEDGRKIEVPR